MSDTADRIATRICREVSMVGILDEAPAIIDEELAPLREAAKALKDALGDASPDTDLCSGREHKEMWERYEAALTQAEEAGI